MQRPLPARSPGDLSPGAAIVLLLYFLIVIGIGFWARAVATAVPGPRTVKQAGRGDVYVQVGTELLRVTPDGVDVRAYDLARLGVERLFAVSHNFMAYRDPITWEPREPKEVAALVRKQAPGAHAELVERLAARVQGRGADEAPNVLKEIDPQLLQRIVEFARGADPERASRW